MQNIYPTLMQEIAKLASRDGLRNECAKPVVPTAHGANCPGCGRFFEREHAERKPGYCEDCGMRLGWGRGEGA